MEELDNEQKCQLNKMLKRYKTDEMTPQIGDIYIFKSLDGEKRAVYCDFKTFSVFKTQTQEEYIDDGCYRKRRYRK